MLGTRLCFFSTQNEAISHQIISLGQTTDLGDKNQTFSINRTKYVIVLGENALYTKDDYSSLFPIAFCCDIVVIKPM